MPPTESTFSNDDPTGLRTGSATGASRSGTSAGSTADRLADTARSTVDKVASAAAPAVERVRQGVNAGVDSVHRAVGSALTTGDAWADDCREAVRQHPLTGLGLAFAVGYLAARLASGR